MSQDIPRTMKAAILVEQRKPLVIGEVTLPEFLEAGQVLVKILYSGICGSQIGEIDGVKGEDPYLPHLLGHEASGRVLDTGPGVTHVTPGDCVVLHWRPGLGIEAVPPTYRWRGRTVNAGRVATFSEYAIVSENRCTVIPKNSDMDIAPLFGCAVTTAFGVLENNARLRIGESVVVYGAGGIGLNMIQAAAMMAADPLVAVDLYDNHLAMAAAMGATHIINGTQENVRRKLTEIFNDGKPDVFIDNTGQPKIIELGYELTAKLGRVILVGVPPVGEEIQIHSLPLHFGKVLTGSHGGESIPHRDIPRFLKLYQSGRLQLRKLLSEEFPLEEINRAIDLLRQGKISGRCLIKPA